MARAQALSLQHAQLPLRDGPRLRRDQIPQRVRGIIPADAILIRVHLEHVLGPARIVLKRRQCLHQAPATPVNEQCRPHAHPGRKPARGAVRAWFARPPRAAAAATAAPRVVEFAGDPKANRMRSRAMRAPHMS
jgi:hypothetical protein